MSLWGCDCPLPALAACCRRGMVCSRLVLFSPLFCVWAWRCLRAFHVVAIPQSGLLAQISSLWLPLGAFRPDPYSKQCSPCLTAQYHWARNLWVLIIYLFFLRYYVALCASKAWHRLGSESVFWCLETSLFLRLPSWDRAPSLPLLSLFLSFIFFLPPFKDNGLLFWVPDVLCWHSEVVLWILLSV